MTMEAHQIFKHARPRVGDPIHYEGKLVGKVTSVEGNLCWCSYDYGTNPFIWAFKDGLNTMHDWPTKANAASGEARP